MKIHLSIYERRGKSKTHVTNKTPPPFHSLNSPSSSSSTPAPQHPPRQHRTRSAPGASPRPAPARRRCAPRRRRKACPQTRRPTGGAGDACERACRQGRWRRGQRAAALRRWYGRHPSPSCSYSYPSYPAPSSPPLPKTLKSPITAPPHPAPGSWTPAPGSAAEAPAARPARLRGPEQPGRRRRSRRCGLEPRWRHYRGGDYRRGDWCGCRDCADGVGAEAAGRECRPRKARGCSQGRRSACVGRGDRR